MSNRPQRFKGKHAWGGRRAADPPGRTVSGTKRNRVKHQHRTGGWDIRNTSNSTNVPTVKFPISHSFVVLNMKPTGNRQCHFPLWISLPLFSSCSVSAEDRRRQYVKFGYTYIPRALPTRGGGALRAATHGCAALWLPPPRRGRNATIRAFKKGKKKKKKVCLCWSRFPLICTYGDAWTEPSRTRCPAEQSWRHRALYRGPRGDTAAPHRSAPRGGEIPQETLRGDTLWGMEKMQLSNRQFLTFNRVNVQ